MNMTKSIVIVDDDPLNAETLETVIRSMGHQTNTFLEPKKMLDNLESLNPKLFLLDVDMPIMNGLELARKIREKPSLSLVPIVFVTGAFAEEQDAYVAFDSGAIDYFSKPYDPKTLELKLNRLLELSDKTQALDCEVKFRDKVDLEMSEAYTNRDELFY